jgi:hypothetical protein
MQVSNTPEDLAFKLVLQEGGDGFESEPSLRFNQLKWYQLLHYDYWLELKKRKFGKRR